MILSFLFNFVLPHDAPQRIHRVEAIRLPLVTTQIIIAALGSDSIVDSRTSHIIQVSLLATALALSVYKHLHSFYQYRQNNNRFVHDRIAQKFNYVSEFMEFLLLATAVGSSSQCIRNGDYPHSHTVNISLSAGSRFSNALHMFLAANFASINRLAIVEQNRQ